MIPTDLSTRPSGRPGGPKVENEFSRVVIKKIVIIIFSLSYFIKYLKF